MHTTRQFMTSLLLAGALGGSASAEVILELIGSTDLTVEQAFPYSPTQPYPITGESLIVWAQMTNTGTEVFQALGPGGISATGIGTTSLWTEPPTAQWDPLSDPDDPLVVAPNGLPGIELEPGESFAIAVAEIWGVQVGGGTPFSPAPIGSYMGLEDLTLSMWDGFDADPNGGDPLDLFIEVGPSFTVTVTPEPDNASILAILALPGVATARRRFVGRCRRTG